MIRFRPLLLSCFGVLAFAAIARPVRAEIEFVGVLITSEQARFSLHDTTTDASAWTETGKTFAGFTVASFDVTDDTLLLRQGDTEKRIRLKDSAKIKATRLELSGAMKFGRGEKVEIIRASLVYDQEAVFPLKDGLTWRITPSRRPDGTILYSCVIERADANGRPERLSAPSIVSPPGKQFGIAIGDWEFSFTPGER